MLSERRQHGTARDSRYFAVKWCSFVFYNSFTLLIFRKTLDYWMTLADRIGRDLQFGPRSEQTSTKSSTQMPSFGRGSTCFPAGGFVYIFLWLPADQKCISTSCILFFLTFLEVSKERTLVARGIGGPRPNLEKPTPLVHLCLLLLKCEAQAPSFIYFWGAALRFFKEKIPPTQRSQKLCPVATKTSTSVKMADP